MSEHLPGTKIAVRLFARPQGATMDEVIAATGGPQYNLLRRLEARGYIVRSRKEGRTTRYWAQRRGAPSYDLTVTSKGQITLPKELREHLGVRTGGKLRAQEDDGRIVLTRQTGTLDDLFGILHRPGMRPRTIEEMDEGIRKAVADRYLRSFKRRR